MRAIIVLALLGSAFAAMPKTTERIVGGTATTIEEYPYMTNMLFGWFGVGFSHDCGGALLTSVSILSAAHCFVGWPVPWFRARLGSSYRSGGGQDINIDDIYNYPGYNDPRFAGDVSIIRLVSPVTFSSTIQPVAIAGPNYHLPDDTPITTMGWGTTTFQGSASEQLQHVVINTINQELCVERHAYLQTQPGFENWPDITSGMLCAGILDVGGKDACQGDSGGPVVYKGEVDVVVGVVSWGYGCGDPVFPGLLARVTEYSQWIETTANSFIS